MYKLLYIDEEKRAWREIGNALSLSDFEMKFDFIPIYPRLNLDDMINEINSLYTLGLNIEDAEGILKNGLEVDGEKQDTSFIKNIVKNNIEKVFKELNISYPVRTSPLIVTGGGGKPFFKSLKKRYPTAQLVEDNLFSNAIGYKRVGDKLWQD